MILIRVPVDETVAEILVVEARGIAVLAVGIVGGVPLRGGAAFGWVLIAVGIIGLGADAGTRGDTIGGSFQAPVVLLAKELSEGGELTEGIMGIGGFGAGTEA